MPRRAVLIFAAAVLLIAAGLGGYYLMNRQLAGPGGSGRGAGGRALHA